MLVWAIYDISDNKKRTLISKMCKKLGLYRVQKSVFLGDIENNRVDELAQLSRSEIDEENDSVYIFPMCEKDFKRVVLIGQAFDKKLVTDEIKNLFI